MSNNRPFLALVLLALSASTATAQVIQPDFWGVDRSVSSIARVGNTIYLAGDFTTVGPNTGGGVPLDPVTGAPIRPFPRVAGIVRAVVPDGSGGWFIGGDFSAVEGAPRGKLAHLLADGSVAPWDPYVDDPDEYFLKPSEFNPVGAVAAIALKGRTLFVGGRFTRVGGQARRYLAAIDAATGAILPFDPSPDGFVTALAARANRLYVGGAFANIADEARSHIASLDLGTGGATAWNPSADRNVLTIDFKGNTACVGGEFDHVGGKARNSIAALDLDTGAATSWDPQLLPLRQYIAHGDWVWPFVSSLVVRGSTLYATGWFQSVRGQDRYMVAAVDLATGVATPFNTRCDGGYGNALALDGSTLYVGGYVHSFHGEVRPNIAAVDAVTGEVKPWNPRANGIVHALAAASGTVFVGGTFTSLHDWQVRQGLAALDATTGAALPWSPTTDSPYRTFSDMVGIGNTLYVCGDFTQIDGQPRGHLAAFDGATGQLTSWNPWTVQVPPAQTGYFQSYPINQVAAIGDQLYVCGQFDQINGVPRTALAAIDARSGSILDWDPHVVAGRPTVNTMRVLGNTIFVSGDFDMIGGAVRAELAAVDGTTGLATSFNPSGSKLSTYVTELLAIAPGDTAVYVGGWFLNLVGQTRMGLAAFEETGALMPWDAGMDVDYTWIVGWQPSTHALALRANTLYVAGRFDQIGGRRIPNVAALDATSGAALDWYTDAIERPGYYEYYGGEALELWGDTLYVGGDFKRFGGFPCAGFAAVALPRQQPRSVTGVALLPADPSSLSLEIPVPNPSRARTTLRFTLPTRSSTTLEVFDLQGRRVACPLQDAPREAGASAIELDTSRWTPGIYYCRLEAAGRTAVQRLLVLR